MHNKNTKVLGPVKRIIGIVLIAITLILSFFIYLHSMTRHREYEDKMIISVFGEQKAYTQMMSKDINQLYMLLLAKETGSEIMTEKELKQEQEKVKANLIQAEHDFASILDALHRNEIVLDSYTIHINSSLVNTSEHVKEIDELWEKFITADKTIQNAEQIDSEVTEALLYINDINLELMGHCDELQDQILEDSLKADKYRQYFSFGMIVLLLVAIIFSLYQLQRYLIQPFSSLYRGISEIGLGSYPTRANFPTKKKIAPVVHEINDMFHKINNLKSLIENINNNDSFTETLNFISSTFSPFIPYNYIGIAMISRDKKYLKASYGVSDGTVIGLPEKIRGASWLLQDTSLETLVNTGESRIINDLVEYCRNKPVKIYNQVLMDAGVKASITLPLKVSGEPVGVIFFSSAKKNVYTPEHLNFLDTLANSIAISLNQSIFVDDVVYSSILALAKLAEARDEDTGDHLGRMTSYARLITELLYENSIYLDEITIEYIDNIERFSPLHDIGKVGISDSILLKPGILTPQEFEEMKKHVHFGADVLRAAEKHIHKRGKSLFGLGAEIAESHHEKWDGSGYPFGRKGIEIPLSGRIVALADVFDALTSKRPYKEAFSVDKALEIIKDGRDKHFDPVIVDVFLANSHRIEQLFGKNR